MTSRDVILSAINHKQTNKIPVDLGSTPSSGISAIAYNNLQKHCNTSFNTKVYDVVQQVVRVDDFFLDKFRVDVVDIERTFNTLDSDWHNVNLSDGSAAQYPAWFNPQKEIDGYKAYSKNGTYIGYMPNGATFFDQTAYPYIDNYPDNYDNLGEAMDTVIWSALVHSPWDNANQADFWSKLRQNAINLKKSTDKAIMIVCGCNLFEWGTFLRRIDNFLMDLLLEPEEVEKLLDALMEKHLQTLENVCKAVGDVVDIIRFGDDLGTDTGTFMSPDIYRRVFKPRHKKLCDYVKSHSNMKIFLHSCGSIYPLIGDLIDCGYDIINPVQTTARDMDALKLKTEFGKDITFWGGGCDTRSTLNRATPEGVKYHVLKNVEILSKDGGFVFNTIHNIMPDVPPENIIAMFDAVNEFGII